MTDVNKAQLRRLAEAATPGQWVTEDEDFSLGGNVIGVYVAHQDGGRIGQAFANCLVPTDAKCRANAAFMAAANPAAVLSLLDELEGAHKRISELEIENLPIGMLRASYQVHKALVEAAGCETIEQLAGQRDAALAELEACRKDTERLDWLSKKGAEEEPEQVDVRGYIDAAMSQDATNA